MKNMITITLVLLIVAASGIFTSCKKDSRGSGSECAKIEFKQKAIIDYTRPCAFAISKSGIVAVVEYNGFNDYGSNGTTSIWNSVLDFLDKKPPVQTFLSKGAEAAAFDAAENLYIAETEGTAGIIVYKKGVQGTIVNYQYKTLIQGNDLSGGFVNPRGLAFDGAGRLYIANDGVGNVVRINDAFNNGPKQIIAGDMGGVKGLAIIGNIMYAANYDKDQIWEITLKANGDFNELVASYSITKPVDIAIKENMLAISSPETGLVTIIDPNKFVRPDETYTGCKKELTAGKNVFGLAFNPLENGLFAAHLDMNRVLYYKN